MQNLIPLIFMVAAVAIFYAGYRVGSSKHESEKDGSFFTPLPTTPNGEDDNSKWKKKQNDDEEEKVNRFYR